MSSVQLHRAPWDLNLGRAPLRLGVRNRRALGAPGREDTIGGEGVALRADRLRDVGLERPGGHGCPSRGRYPRVRGHGRSSPGRQRRRRHRSCRRRSSHMGGLPARVRLERDGGPRRGAACGGRADWLARSRARLVRRVRGEGRRSRSGLPERGGILHHLPGDSGSPLREASALPVLRHPRGVPRGRGAGSSDLCVWVFEDQDREDHQQSFVDEVRVFHHGPVPHAGRPRRRHGAPATSWSSLPTMRNLSRRPWPSSPPASPSATCSPPSSSSSNRPCPCWPWLPPAEREVGC
jgi:hypothetical protein